MQEYTVCDHVFYTWILGNDLMLLKGSAVQPLSRSAQCPACKVGQLRGFRYLSI